MSFVGHNLRKPQNIFWMMNARVGSRKLLILKKKLKCRAGKNWWLNMNNSLILINTHYIEVIATTLEASFLINHTFLKTFECYSSLIVNLFCILGQRITNKDIYLVSKCVQNLSYLGRLQNLFWCSATLILILRIWSWVSGQQPYCHCWNLFLMNKTALSTNNMPMQLEPFPN